MRTILGILLGLLVGLTSVSGWWIDAPTDPSRPDFAEGQGYSEPTCPPGFGVSLFGVLVDGGVSKPIYVCDLRGGNDTTAYRWRDAETV